MVYCKRILLAIFFFCCLLSSFSQSSTLEIKKSSSISGADLPDAQFNRVMVIPFDHKMYMSQADKELASGTAAIGDSLSIGEKQLAIRDIFQKGICNNVFIECKMVHNSAYKAVSMHSEDPDIIADLDYIYKSIGYSYAPVPVQPDTAKPTVTASLKKASDKAQEIFDNKISNNEPPGTRIKNGQIASTPEKREKYMKTTIVNPEALAYLSSKYQCDFFIFINQMDLLIPSNTDYRDLSSDDYSRLIKIHYSIMDKSGNEIYGDGAKSYSSSRQNDANAIVGSHFDDIAKEIVTHLNDPAQTKAVQEKNAVERKNAARQRSSFDDY